MAIIKQKRGNVIYVYESIYEGFENGKRKYKRICLGHLDENGNLIPSKKNQRKAIKDAPTELVLKTTTTKVIIRPKPVETPPLPHRASSYSLIFDGKVTQALGRARTNGVYDPFSRQLKVTNGVNIFLPDSVHKIGVGTAKLFRYAATKFTKLNSANEKGKNLNLRVFFDAKDFAAVTNTEITSEDTMKNLRRTIKEDLETLLHSSVEAEEKIKGQKTHYSGLNYIGKYDIKGDTIEIEFTLTMAEYLTSLPLLTYSQALYRINNREINAYAIGEALCLHYSQENNVVKGTENKLRVETLLNYTSFPTWEEIKEKRLSWEQKVKEPFLNALDVLTQCGFLKDYSLCYEGGIEISDEEMITGEPVDSYQKFISLILKYELNNFAPHQERLADITQKKAEQIALFIKTRRKKNKKKADDNSHDE